MHKKWLLVLSLILIAGIIFYSTRPQDRWECREGTWTRIGSPKTTQPTTPCVGNANKPKLPDTPPESILYSLYSTFKIAKTSPSPELSLGTKYYSASFKNKISKNIKTCFETQTKNISIRKRNITNSTASVLVDQTIDDKKIPVIFDLIVSDEIWLIDNISCPK